MIHDLNIRHVKNKQIIYDINSKANSLFFIKSGEVEITTLK